MAKESELVKITSSAFLNLVLHVFRFWSKKDYNFRKISYGALLGYLEGDIRHIRKVVPLLHTEKADYKMEDDFMKKVGLINKRELDAGSPNEVIGWYRSSNDGIKFTAYDIKNHIRFQDHNPLFIGLVFDPEDYFDPDSYGFSVFRLEGNQYYNMMTDYYRIPWEIEEVSDANEIVMNFRGYIRNYFLDKPLIMEFEEI